MDKHYVEKILEMFEKEKNVVYFFNEDYVPQLKTLFDLDKCNVQTLKAIRDAVTFKIELEKEKDLDNRHWYSKVIAYVTEIIEDIIYEKDGEV